MHDISRTLIIGLGGTGQKVIRDVKKRLFQRYGEIPPLVKFLAFDTDYNDYQDLPFRYYYEGEVRETQKYNLQRGEFKQIGRPGIEVLIDDPICKNLNYTELSRVYGLSSPVHTGGSRILGRAHLLYNSGEIMAMLNKVVGELRNANLLETERAEKGYHVDNNNINVYVVASLTSGLGSGALMDISRMLQHAGINMTCNGSYGPPDRIYGVFFTPSPFDKMVVRLTHYTNAYVALSELDYTLDLNDTDRYPVGCEELKNDLNVYEGYKTYQPVRYSNIYLIGIQTKKGRSVDYGDACGTVASYIASFTNSTIANSIIAHECISYPIHCKYGYKGKKQRYSGLGYCEIRLDRQSLVKYLLNRQLLKVLASYKDDDSFKVDGVVEKFLEDNQLNEGMRSMEEGMEDTCADLSELTDSIFDLRDSRFACIVMGRAQLGKNAASDIENSKERYLNALDVSAREAIKAFALRKKLLLDNLRLMLGKYQVQKGFGKFPDLAKRLKDAFVNMKSGLKYEIAHHQAKMAELEADLKRIKSWIDDNSSKGFLGIGNKTEVQKVALLSYSKKVELASATEIHPTLGSLRLEIARKEEAVAVYDELINVIGAYYKEEEVETDMDMRRLYISGASLDVVQIYDVLRDLLWSECFAYDPSRIDQNDVVYVDAYFKEYFESHLYEAFNITEWEQEKTEQYIHSIFVERPKVDNDLIATMRESLLGLLSEDVKIKKIQRSQLSLDQLFIDCFGVASDISDQRDYRTYPQLGLFRKLDSMFDVLWSFDDFKGDGSLPTDYVCNVGVCDNDSHVFDSYNGYHAFLPSCGFPYNYTRLGDPDRIVFMLQEIAIPAFVLKEAAHWKKDYQRKRGSFHAYSYSDRRLEEIEMIFPEEQNIEAEIAWAYGWLFGLIASVRGRIRVKPSDAYMRGKCRVKDNEGYYDYFTRKPSDLKVCHREFIGDEKLYEDIFGQVMALLENDKPGVIIRVFHWVNDDEIWANRGKQVSSMSDEERQVIQNELQYLAKCFNRLSSGTLSISFDETTQRVAYDDPSGALEQRELEYQQARKVSGSEE